MLGGAFVDVMGEYRMIIFNVRLAEQKAICCEELEYVGVVVGVQNKPLKFEQHRPGNFRFVCKRHELRVDWEHAQIRL